MAANAEAFTRLAEPVFIVGIRYHIIGTSFLKITMAPDKPGSIPIFNIIFFQKVLQDMKVCGYNVLPIVTDQLNLYKYGSARRGKARRGQAGTGSLRQGVGKG